MALSLRDRKVQYGIGGGVVVIVLAVLVMTVLGGGGSTSAVPTITTPSTLQPSPTPKPTPTTIAVFSGRDPFQNLFGTSSPSPSGTGSPSPSGTGSPSPSGTGSPSPSGSGSPPPSSGSGDGSQSSTQIGGHSVLLDDVFIAQGGVRKAQVEVDGTVYTVAAGQSFDDNFKLVSFPSASCARFVFGDEGFTLCTSGGK